MTRQFLLTLTQPSYFPGRLGHSVGGERTVATLLSATAIRLKLVFLPLYPDYRKHVFVIPICRQHPLDTKLREWVCGMIRDGSRPEVDMVGHG